MTIVHSRRPVNYLNNKDLLEQVCLSKKQGRMTDKLAHMLQTLTAKYGKKGNFAGYTYNDDMQAFAMLMIVKTWNSFDPTKSSNPFAFYTQCIKNSFKQYLNQERKQRDIRDLVLTENGLTPSHTFQINQRTNSDTDIEIQEQHLDRGDEQVNTTNVQYDSTDEMLTY